MHGGDGKTVGKDRGGGKKKENGVIFAEDRLMNAGASHMSASTAKETIRVMCAKNFIVRNMVRFCTHRSQVATGIGA
jgi:hypothetical protein